MMKFTHRLTEVEIMDLELEDNVLVVNTNNDYEPFIGRVAVNDSLLKNYGNKIIKDINAPEGFVGLSEDDTMIFGII